VNTHLDDRWVEIHAQLRRAVPAGTYELWLQALQAREVGDTTLVISAPDSSARWVAERFGRVLQTCAAAVLGPEVEVEVIPASATHAPGQRVRGDSARGPRLGEPPRADELNPKYSFDQFVIGEGNRLAHAAALAVAELPGHAYNPLFVYGPPGVGKTHLLQSIAHYVGEHGGGLSVRYTTIEAFTTGFVSALQSGSIERFKAGYRRADVLLIDDVQFLEDKTRTEEEFFHTFNALYETGSQLVISSDRLPRDMAALEERLCERFESGLVTDILAPDFDTRMTILCKRADHDGLSEIPRVALERIAERVTDNVRALEGALIRVVAYHSLTGRPIEENLVTEVLDRLYPAPRRRARSVEDVQEMTCRAFDVSLDDLVSPSRSAHLVWPRQLAMYLSRELTAATLPAIGRQFGGRNHTTVIHACRRARERLTGDAEASATAQHIKERLEGPLATDALDRLSTS